jgi:hypothetical protein
MLQLNTSMKLVQFTPEKWQEIWQPGIKKQQRLLNRIITRRLSYMITRLGNKFGWMNAIFSTKIKNWHLIGLGHF